MVYKFCLVIKRKGDKPYVKWKDHDDAFDI